MKNKKIIESKLIFKVNFKILAPKKRMIGNHVILQNKEEGHNKHYELLLEPNKITTIFGKIGTNYQRKVHHFSDNNTAKRHMNKLVESKLKKGYKQINNIKNN